MGRNDNVADSFILSTQRMTMLFQLMCVYKYHGRDALYSGTMLHRELRSDFFVTNIAKKNKSRTTALVTIGVHAMLKISLS